MKKIFLILLAGLCCGCSQLNTSQEIVNEQTMSID